MKKLILFTVILFSIATCKKSSSPQSNNGSMIGKWKLSENLLDPRDGSGIYHPADPSNPVYIEFKADGTLIMTPTNIFSDRYEITSDSTIRFGSDPEKFTTRYHFTKTLLTLYGPCYTVCIDRFIPSDK
jgi:hypothetical protein